MKRMDPGNVPWPEVKKERKSLPHMLWLFFLFPLIAALPTSAQQSAWYLLSRVDGCADLQILVRMEKLSRAPVSPEDFVQMMRERGKEVAVGPLADFPPELIGKVVQVNIGDGNAPVFVKEEICRTIDRVR